MSPAENHMPEPQGDRQPTILVVEDDVLQRLGVADHLRDNGFSVVEAATAEEARAVLEAGVEVDLIFSDINTPGGIDGIALAQWACAHDEDVIITLVSGVPSGLEAAKAACPQVSAVFIKPADYDELVRSFRSLLALRAKRG